MKTKFITREFIKDLFEVGSYYYLEGSCPELMSFPRLIEYANNIHSNNQPECKLHNLVDAWDYESALKIIAWFGEEVYKIELPSNSVDFIIEE